MQRSRGLDGVRGVAISLILVWHYLPRGASPRWLVDSIGMFWGGVDLFFVLSGFLIGGILLKNASSASYFSTFYVRRTARIVPLYLVVLGLLAALVVLAPAALRTSYQGHLPAWSYLTFTQNFYYAGRRRLGDPFLDVTWSLAVEEQFYVLLSLMVRFLSRRLVGVLAGGLVILAPVLRLLASHPLAAYLLPLHRADSLMLGVLIALAWQSNRGRAFLSQHTGAFRWAFPILLLGAASMTFRGVRIGDPLGHFWLALLYGTGIVLVLLREAARRELPVLQGRIMVWFGLRSYGIYLLHKPAKLLVPFLVGGPVNAASSSWMVTGIAAVVVLSLSEISYRFLEAPVLAKARRFEYADGGLAPGPAEPLTLAP